MMIESVPVGMVKLHPRNYRQGDIGALMTSLSAHGQYIPILVQRSTGYIYKGNHTYRAIRELGWESVQVIFDDISDEETLRRLVNDNAASDLASNNEDSLSALLEELANTENGLTGMLLDGDDLDELLKRKAGDDAAASIPSGDASLDTGTIWRPRISSKLDVTWLTLRSWRANRKKAAIAALKAAKDSSDPIWVSQIADEMFGVIAGTFPIFDQKTVVGTCPSRESAHKGITSFASLIAKATAERLRLQYVQLFEDQPTNRKGHHPNRERPEPVPVVGGGQRILLIDDVATSGITISTCIKALRGAGGIVMPVVWVYDDATDEEPI